MCSSSSGVHSPPKVVGELFCLALGGSTLPTEPTLSLFFVPCTQTHRQTQREHKTMGMGRPSCCQCHSCDHRPITMPKTKAQLRKKQNRDAKRQRVSFASLTPPRAGGTLSAPAPLVINTDQSNCPPVHQTSLPSQGMHANLN